MGHTKIEYWTINFGQREYQLSQPQIFKKHCNTWINTTLIIMWHYILPEEARRHWQYYHVALYTATHALIKNLETPLNNIKTIPIILTSLH